MVHISMNFNHFTCNNRLTFEMTGQITYTFFFIAYVNTGIEHLISDVMIEWYFKTLIKQ